MPVKTTTRKPRVTSAAATVATLSLVTARAATNVPVRTGVCLPRGEVSPDARFVLHDERDCPVATQSRVLATWPDGSVQWVLVDGVAERVELGATAWTLRAGEAIGRGPDPAAAIDVVHHRNRMVLFDVPDRTRSAFAADVRLRATVHGRTRITSWTDVATTEEGPVRRTRRFTGRVHGVRVRVLATSFAALGLVRLDVTLHNPRRARHRGGYWDLGDPNATLLDGCELAIDVREPGSFVGVESTATPGAEPVRSDWVSFVQESSGGDQWDARTHVDRDGRVPMTERGCRVERAGASSRIDRASPTVALVGDGGSVSVAVPEFWERFPTSLAAGDGRVCVGLFPEAGGPHELQPGERTTRTIWLSRGNVGGLGWVHEPVDFAPTPETVSAANVLPWCDADPEHVARLEVYLAPTIAPGPASLFEKRETADEYGWRNFGDLWADHEAAYFDGERPIVSHYNGQFDPALGFLLHHLRTGDPRWRRLLDPLVRHLVDVDRYHTDADRACYNGGLFWHTDHYVSAETATHRTYARANAANSPGGGTSCEHNYTTGLLHHHLLTGDDDAREAVIGLAEWVLAMDDGSRTPFAVVDDGPTGYATSTCAPDYHGPGRGAGNSVNALLDAWTLTGERRYLDVAETLIRRVVHPRDDVAALELLDVERRWSYTVFLASLVRYLEAKAAAGENDAMYAYGVASLLRYAEWMADHERPYFDHAEQLEYPTETWAAQEFRKANALRFAARWADGPLRARLLERGAAFSARAWADLEGFDSRHVTRAVVILMVEGMKDAHLASRPDVGHPHPAESPDFGEPLSFVPQRARFKAALRSPVGWLRIARRLADVRRWPRLAGNLWRHL